MAIQDVQGILQALVAGQGVRQSGIDTELRRQQLQQQAAQNLAQNELMQQQHKLETDRLNFQNQSEIARRNAENIALKMKLSENPDFAAAVGTPIGVPDESGHLRYEVTGVPADPTGKDLSPLEFNAPTREQYLKDLGQKSIASQAGARELEDVRYAHNQSESDAQRTFQEELERRRELAANERSRLERSTQLAIAGMHYNVDNSPEAVKLVGDRLINGTYTTDDINTLKASSPGLATAATKYVTSNGATVQKKDDIKGLEGLSQLAQVIPNIKKMVDDLGVTGSVLPTADLHNKVATLDQIVQPIVKALGDTSLRSAAIINMTRDAYTPSTLPTRENANRQKVNALIDQVEQSIEKLTRGMSAQQKKEILGNLKLDQPLGKYAKNLPDGKYQLGTDPKTGKLVYTTDGGKTTTPVEFY